jgi:hypothetical protein
LKPPRQLRSGPGIASLAALALVAIALTFLGWLRLRWLLWLLVMIPLIRYLERRNRYRESVRNVRSSRFPLTIHRLLITSAECARFPDEVARDGTVRQLELELTDTWWFTPLWGGACLLLFVALDPLSNALSAAIPLMPAFVAYMIVLAAWFFGFMGTVWVIYRGYARHRLREVLVALGVPICLHCGYDLRGQTVPRCPECGREFDPGLLKQRREGEGRVPVDGGAR